ncbi:hypothetical protein B0H12DRAFT_1139017 [Mycena haematopus]|nr:hypothetical protein B0H12DRAFT_1139017 [Mycena haematopus]
MYVWSSWIVSPDAKRFGRPHFRRRSVRGHFYKLSRIDICLVGKIGRLPYLLRVRVELQIRTSGVAQGN